MIAAYQDLAAQYKHEGIPTLYEISFQKDNKQTDIYDKQLIKSTIKVDKQSNNLRSWAFEKKKEKT